MNRYCPINTDNKKVRLLDSIIRLPDKYIPSMNREAKAIRDSLPELSLAVLRSKNRASIVCAVMGTGWEPMPDNPYFDRYESGRVYKEAITRLADYLEKTGALYEGLIIA